MKKFSISIFATLATLFLQGCSLQTLDHMEMIKASVQDSKNTAAQHYVVCNKTVCDFISNDNEQYRLKSTITGGGQIYLVDMSTGQIILSKKYIDQDLKYSALK